jgi:hypothetical protein
MAGEAARAREEQRKSRRVLAIALSLNHKVAEGSIRGRRLEARITRLSIKKVVRPRRAFVW